MHACGFPMLSISNLSFQISRLVDFQSMRLPPPSIIQHAQQAMDRKHRPNPSGHHRCLHLHRHRGKRPQRRPSKSRLARHRRQGHQDHVLSTRPIIHPHSLPDRARSHHDHSIHRGFQSACRRLRPSASQRGIHNIRSHLFGLGTVFCHASRCIGLHTGFG